MEFTLKRKLLKLFGAEMRIYDQSSQIVALAKAKAFKLREDITIFSDESMQNPLVLIKAKNIIDISATYEIMLPDGTQLGSMTRKGIKSFLVRDEWIINNPDGFGVGSVAEEGAWLSFFRRVFSLISLIYPQKYLLTYKDQQLGVFKRTYNLMAVRYNMNFEVDAFNKIDQRLAFASVVLLALIDSSKQ